MIWIKKGIIWPDQAASSLNSWEAYPEWHGKYNQNYVAAYVMMMQYIRHYHLNSTPQKPIIIDTNGNLYKDADDPEWIAEKFNPGAASLVALAIQHIYYNDVSNCKDDFFWAYYGSTNAYQNKTYLIPDLAGYMQPFN